MHLVYFMCLFGSLVTVWCFKEEHWKLDIILIGMMMLFRLDLY